jgi:ribosomal protein S12 methylthiotransferase accessory factor
MLDVARLVEALISQDKGDGTRGFFSPYLDRRRAPAETVALMRARFPEFGITRLARVTGLDNIGIPVWSAIRPNSRTLSVSQGKGVDDDAAAASAIMEAIEVATAERADLPRIACSADAMNAAGRSVALHEGLLRADAMAPAPGEALDWIEGYDLISQSPVWVPLEAVALSDGRVKPRYWQSTDGLASGNILWEAVFHGLCERIERDALALWALRGDSWIAGRCCDPALFDDPELDRLVARIENAGLQLRLFDITSDIGVAVSFAAISPIPSGQEIHWTHFDLSSGSGCHPNRARAAIRAVTEAAQTRLTTISAARDDFDPQKYRAPLSADLLAYVRAAPRRAEAAAVVDEGVSIDGLVARLRAVGVRSIVVVPLAADDSGYAVAKVLIAGLETVAGERRFMHGKRALRAMLASP